MRLIGAKMRSAKIKDETRINKSTWTCNEDYSYDRKQKICKKQYKIFINMKICSRRFSSLNIFYYFLSILDLREIECVDEKLMSVVTREYVAQREPNAQRQQH